jgi:hypothetical protein
MSERMQGLLIGVILTLFCQLVMHIRRCLKEEEHPRRHRDDEAMKRHLDELYQDIDRGKVP